MTPPPVDRRPARPLPPADVTLSSRRGFDGAWLHVRVDQVRLPSGRDSTREVVEHPGAVAIVALTDDDQVLLLTQYHHAIGRTLLGLPAGTLDPGEAPAVTAARELTEETGYVARQLTVLHSYYTSPGYTNERMTIFRADGCRPAGTELDPDELIVVTPVDRAAIPHMLASGQFEDAKTLIGLLSVFATGD